MSFSYYASLRDSEPRICAAEPCIFQAPRSGSVRITNPPFEARVQSPARALFRLFGNPDFSPRSGKKSKCAAPAQQRRPTRSSAHGFRVPSASPALSFQLALAASVTNTRVQSPARAWAAFAALFRVQSPKRLSIQPISFLKLAILSNSCYN